MTDVIEAVDSLEILGFRQPFKIHGVTMRKISGFIQIVVRQTGAIAIHGIFRQNGGQMVQTAPINTGFLSVGKAYLDQANSDLNLLLVHVDAFY